MRSILTTLFLLCTVSLNLAADSDELNNQILSLLRQYSPDGAKIVEMEKANENELNPWNPSEYLVFEPYTEQNIVASLPLTIQQADLGRGDLVQQQLRLVGSPAGLESAYVRHLPIGRTFDDVGIALEQLYPQQAIVVGWLLLRGNPQPFIIGIKGFRHRQLETVP